MDSKPLNPRAEPWLPNSSLPLQRKNTSPPSHSSQEKKIDQANLIPHEISTPKLQYQNMYTTFIYYYIPTSYTQFFHLQNVPFHYPTYYSPLAMKNEGSLVEGERVLKKLLKIDVGEEKKRNFRRFFPPRFKKNVCKKWRAKELVDGGNSKTTVMIKNIPNQFRRKCLMVFLDYYCREHHLEYDFLYLPMDFKRKFNLGYAFVNFTTASSALKIKATLEGYKWGVFKTANGQFKTRKICEITWAIIQGKDALLNHFKRSFFVCHNEEYLPVVISPPRNGFNSSSATTINVGNMYGQFHAPRMLKKVS